MQTFTSILKIKDAADTLKDFSAPQDGALHKFAQKNLIYGYNGAGKTTISRIFAYIGTSERPEGLSEKFSFELALEGGGTLSKSSDLTPYASRVLVYNEDYIERNFAWTSGTAQPIFGLGEQNIADAEALNAARSRRDKLAGDLSQTKQLHQAAQRALDTFCRGSARTIEQRAAFTGRSFNATRLKARYAADDFDPSKTLASEQLQQAEQTLGQAPPAKIQPLHAFDVLIDQSIQDLAPLLARSGTQIKLPELQSNPEMESWAKRGHEYHASNDLDDCLFCGQKLTEDRINELAAHFSEEINQISRQASAMMDAVVNAREALQSAQANSPSPEQLITIHQPGYAKLADQRTQLAVNLTEYFQSFEQLLRTKLAEPASPISDAEAQFNASAFAEIYNSYRSAIAEQIKLIQAHNDFVDRFDEERDLAREQIAVHLLAENHTAFQEHSIAMQSADQAVKALERDVADNHSEIETREAALREHASATPELNKEIEAFLRHADIILHAVNEGYQLRRADGTVVSRLSEGEKTAITFCHFITSIESDNRKLKDSIIVIDDPISSLDTRALTYMASLIRDRLDKAGQLFIFTHNAPFMSEMRKWIYSRSMQRNAKEAHDQGGEEPNIPLFHLSLRFDHETKRRWATLENMSRLLRDYEGEYHYLYSVVYNFSGQPNPTSELFLLLPNAIRKVMETYLLFKVPNNNNFGSAIEQMAKMVPNRPKYYALRKFAEMEGHSEDLTAITQPATLTIEEAHPAAQELIDLIMATDKTHADQMKKLCDRSPAN